MTTHWIHITASWGLTLATFGGLAIAAMLRSRAAAATLKRLDPRGDSRAGGDGRGRDA
ncbi:heme exporter protein CcmD [Falsiroseomonas sp.]|uniref:heme exporter protein CcmD n=1 Tax=Falsiroseomonas sp. TaxID=2870721 RepID=UPI003F7128C0